MGSVALPFELSDCAGDVYPLYGPEWCDATLTVIEMQAGWCGSSRVSAAELEAEIVQRYGPLGVRVIEVLIQDNGYEAPDSAFCEEWAALYGLSNPVLLDPTQVTQIYFPAGSLPALVIVDSEGVIRYRQYGHDLPMLQGALDALLAGVAP